ncbi:phenylacetate--CoA ligase family protein [Halomonas binhaiensis]|uniref:Phenylacetate-coenzyme A ligase n=1 Tax=Halomonas binhaiensis TaxID=2562282 RepID=A0A5C1NH80_9GAMM|nr:phenylacetate--CoA ligase [Halomonas binhaiensis]QEM82270.1 phenylacetate--CoA ligase [Halomonas binhaiensis]
MFDNSVIDGKENLCQDLEEYYVNCIANALKRIRVGGSDYQSKLLDFGVSNHDVNSLRDINSLPFTTKKDFQENYPYGLFAVPLSEVVRLHSSSGTKNRPKIVGYTKNDIRNWETLVLRCLMMHGLSKDDIVHNSFGYGMFTGGLGLQLGVEASGATLVPASSGNTRKQIDLLRDLKATVLLSTPSFAMHLSEQSEKLNFDISRSPLRLGFMGAEPWPVNMKQQIEKALGIKAVNIYGLSEIMGPGVGVEDPNDSDSIILWSDHFYVEIVNEEGELVPDGCYGELVITSFLKEALPLIRYRTGDITRIVKRKGLSGVWVERIASRSDDMLIVKGVNMFPSQVETVLCDFPELSPYYLLEIEKHGFSDHVILNVELSRGKYNFERSQIYDISERLRKSLKDDLGVHIDIKIFNPGVLERCESKRKTVNDKRENADSSYIA